MRRLAWDRYKRRRHYHELAVEMAGDWTSIEALEHYFADWRGYAGRVAHMPACVFRKRHP